MKKFEEELPRISTMAETLSKVWCKKIEANELINEAWIRDNLSGNKPKDVKLLMTQVKRDMIDYARQQIGRKVLDKKESAKKTINIYDCELIEKVFIDTSLEKIDIEEENEYILSILPEKEKNAIIYFHKDGKQLKEVGDLLNGMHRSSVCIAIKRGLKKCSEFINENNIERF